MSWQKTLQLRLGVKGDGVLGAITYSALFRRLGAQPAVAALLGQGAAAHVSAYEIDATGTRLTEWIGEMAHESQSFTRFVENLYYSSAARLMAVWPARFRTLAAAQPFVGRPEELANHVYGGRLGNVHDGDGWRFRGRGLVHLTGRANYEAAALRLGLPLAGQPDIAAQPAAAVEVACDYWRQRRFNLLADQGRSDDISRAINGGSNGLADRRKRKADFRRLWQ